jgi:hypothetical protein
MIGRKSFEPEELDDETDSLLDAFEADPDRFGPTEPLFPEDPYVND